MKYVLNIIQPDGPPPPPERLDPNGPFLSRALKQPTGTYTAVSQVDGIERLNAYSWMYIGGKLLYTLRMSVGDAQTSRNQDFAASITPPAGYADQNPNDNFVIDSVLVSMPPLGPDLSVKVREELSDHDNSVTYVIDVENRGEKPAPGATLVYDVPAGTTVQIDAGPGWSCGLSASGSQVVCTRTEPIPPGPASSVRITVTAPNPGMELPLHTTVNGTDPDRKSVV